jgi:phospholipid transport system substrate-binding protein
MRKLLVTVIAACAWHAAGAAQSGATPDETIRRAVENTVKAAKADPAARDGDIDATTRVVAREFLPYTDFARTTRLAVGAAWTRATPEQQKQLVALFQTLLVHTYAVQLTQIHDQQVSFSYGQAKVGASGSDAVVQASVKGMSAGGDDLDVGYRLGKTPEGWKIYDIDMMGAWLILVYSQQFTDQINKGGIDGLIRFLSEHNARFGK